MRGTHRLIFVFWLISTTSTFLLGQTDPPSPPPEIEIANVEISSLDVAFDQDLNKAALLFRHRQDGRGVITVNGEHTELLIRNGIGRLELDVDEAGRLFMLRTPHTHKLVHVAKLSRGGYRYKHIPLWLSILPPLIAIGLALLFKEVIISLFAGVWVGAFIAGGLRFESLFYLVQSFFRAVSQYVIEALTNSGHMSVIVFSLLIGEWQVLF